MACLYDDLDSLPEPGPKPAFAITNAQDLKVLPARVPLRRQWINEIHYDDSGGGTNEFVEIAGRNVNVCGLTLRAYNAPGANTATVNLEDVDRFDNLLGGETNGFGTLTIPMTLGNGPNALALVDEVSGELLDFVSWEGTITAFEGPPAVLGQTSIDIGVVEGPSTSPTDSLQLAGRGIAKEDFVWLPPAVRTDDAFNVEQRMVIKEWINEFHYNDTSGGTDEFVEIAGRAGEDVSDLTLHLYEDDGTTYASLPLLGTIPNEVDGFGTLAFDIDLHDGPLNGIALVDDVSDKALHFISYGTTVAFIFPAPGEPAEGQYGIPIGGASFEDSGTPVGSSLQLTGVGSRPSDFLWGLPIPDTKDLPNTSQLLHLLGERGDHLIGG